MKATFVLIYFLITLWTFVWCSKKLNPLEDVWDPKQFKQILRTRTNILVLFTNAKTTASSVYNVFSEAAREVRGLGTLLNVDCSGQGKKLCRQQKASPNPHVMHHYKDGKFHKVYDRKEAVKSIVHFMQDPTGDIPWDEEPSGKSVIHLESIKSLEKLLKKHETAMVMFYAPWCIYCKQMKPEYAGAASIVRSQNLGVLAAMDVVRHENAQLRGRYNITGFPTIYLFKDGNIIASYEGENKRGSLVEFLKNPKSASTKAKEEVPWNEELSEVYHLTAETFDESLKENPSSLVMFYAPWCGHCKKLKPEWMKAAGTVKSQKVTGIVAAVDATQEKTLAQRFKVKGYPTIKYFKDGQFAFDTPDLRDEERIVEFMKNPKEPPPPPPPEPSWADVPSEVLHLNQQNFMSQLRSKRHALVMFYAPWCHHCKAAKPEFEGVAEKLKEEPRMVVAAVDCVENEDLCQDHQISGYPTFKYLRYFKESSDYIGGRKMDDFLQFFKNLEPESMFTSNNSPTVTEQSPTITNEKVERKESEQLYSKEKNDVYLTHENYIDELSKSDRLLVMFTSKSCGSCKELKDMLDELGDNIVTLGFCQAEESPHIVKEFNVTFFPTLKYFHKGQFVEDFHGEHSIIQLQKFLQKINNIKDEL